MVFLQPYLTSLLKSFPAAPVDAARLKEGVCKTIEETQNKLSPESRKGQWEFLLKSDILHLAVRRGHAFCLGVILTVFLGHRRNGCKGEFDEILCGIM